EVARVRLEDAARVRADRVEIVAHVGAVRRPDLAQSRAGRGDEVGQAEAVADLDHLPAGDDDLPAGGEGRRREDEGGGSVVHGQGAARVGDRLEERREGADAPPAPRAGRQVQLDVDVLGGVGYRLDGAGGERGPAEVGVHDDPGRVEHRREGGGAGGQDRQGGGGDLGRGDVPGTGTLLRGDDRGSDAGAPEPRRGGGEGWLCEQGV